MCNSKWYVYIARCRDGKLYTGLTQNVKERIKRHNDGRGNRFTKYRRPLVLLHTEEFRTKSQARKRELQIKGLTREKKLSLIKGYIAV